MLDKKRMSGVDWETKEDDQPGLGFNDVQGLR